MIRSIGERFRDWLGFDASVARLFCSMAAITALGIADTAAAQCGAIDLGSESPASAYGTTDESTNSMGGSACEAGATGGDGAPDAVYEWTAPAAGYYAVALSGLASPGYQPLLSIRAAGCAGAELTCSSFRPGAYPSTSAVVSLSASQTLIVVVDGMASTSGSYALDIWPVSQPCLDLSLQASEVAYPQASGSTYPPAPISCPLGGPTTATRSLVDDSFTVRNALYRWDTSVLPPHMTLADFGARLSLGKTVEADDDERLLTTEWVDWSGSCDSGGGAPAVLGLAHSLSIGEIFGSDFDLADFGTYLNRSGSTALQLRVSGGAPAGSNEVEFSDPSLWLRMCDWSLLPTATPTDTPSPSPTPLPPTVTPTDTATGTPTPTAALGCCSFSGANPLAVTCVDNAALEDDLRNNLSVDVCALLSGLFLGGDPGVFNPDGVCGPEPGNVAGSCPPPPTATVTATATATPTSNATLIGAACGAIDLGHDIEATAYGSTAESTNSMGGSACEAGDSGGDDAPDVVYQWTAPSAGYYGVSIIGFGSPDYQPLLSVRGGCADAELGCSAFMPNTQPPTYVVLSLSAGQTIIAAVDGVGATSGSYGLYIFPLTQPCLNFFMQPTDVTYAEASDASYPPAPLSCPGSGSTTVTRSVADGTFTVRDGLFRWDTSVFPLSLSPTDFGVRASLVKTLVANDDERQLVTEWVDWDGTCSEPTVLGFAHSFALSEPLSTASDLLNYDYFLNRWGSTGLRMRISGGEPTGANEVEFADAPELWMRMCDLSLLPTATPTETETPSPTPLPPTVTSTRTATGTATPTPRPGCCAFSGSNALAVTCVDNAALGDDFDDLSIDLCDFLADEFLGGDPGVFNPNGSCSPERGDVGGFCPPPNITPTVTPTESGLPPDPASVATPLSLSEVTTIGDSVDFLYTGPDPIQTGVAPGTIDSRRAAVLRGSVRGRDGNPIQGATIAVHNHPEFGETRTRADGMFDLVVNGGGALTVTYAKAGLIEVQRTVSVPWQDYLWLPDVVMIGYDTRSTTVTFPTADTVVARGSTRSDADGMRRATLLFPPSTSATAIAAGEPVVPTELVVRATEYTVGETGPEAMPAELPPSTGYTYAVELSADGYDEVTFDQPVSFYLENFLNFPVGDAVPAGYYSRKEARWIPSDNGRVIAITGVADNLALLDTDGDGIDDDGAAIGVTSAERERLALLFPTPQTLWRVPITHFTPWDCNYAMGPPGDARQPQSKIDRPDAPEDEPDCVTGSIVECQNQTLGETISLPGVPFDWQYQSDRVPGRSGRYRLQLDVIGDDVPASLERIEVFASIAGQRQEYTLSNAANQALDIIWDGRDGYGRIVQGEQPINITVAYVYRAVYMIPELVYPAFMRLSGIPYTANRARREVSLLLHLSGTLGTWNAAGAQLAGLTPHVHHAYDPRGRVLYLGNGRRRSANQINEAITTIAGTGTYGAGGDGGPAIEAELSYPRGIDVAEDGSVYVADTSNHEVRRIDPDGSISTVAGGGLFFADGVSATAVALGSVSAVASDDRGGLYVASAAQRLVYYVDRFGLIWRFAGGGSSDADGVPATGIAFAGYPMDVDVGPDGSVYIAEGYQDDQEQNYTEKLRVRQVTPDGIITTLAGTGEPGDSGDGGPARQAQFNNPHGVAAAADGNVYVADYWSDKIRRVGPDGLITTVAGGGLSSADGIAATSAALGAPGDVAVAPDGSLYVTSRFSHRVRHIGQDGVINTVAGSGCTGFTCGGYAGDGGAATSALLGFPSQAAVGTDGSVYIADYRNHRIRRVSPPLPGPFELGNALVASEDGSELYVFSNTGRHLSTRSTVSGAVLYAFGYEANRLVTIADADGNTTEIERDSNGLPTSVRAPFGQTTTFDLDPNAYLSLLSAAGQTLQFWFTDTGLLERLRDARGNDYEFTYDPITGQLLTDSDPAGGSKTLARTGPSGNYAVTLTTGEGRTSQYAVERLPSGEKVRRTTAADGTTSETVLGTGGQRSSIAADGTVRSLAREGDQRFGMVAPVPAEATISTPGGRLLATTSERTVLLDDPNNPLSLLAQTDILRVNGRPFTSELVVGSPTTRSQTTPEGRQSVSELDAVGRVTSTAMSGLHPLRWHYDSAGRVDSVAQGPDPDPLGLTRTTTFEYYDDPGTPQHGALRRIVDAEAHVTEFTYDTAGRVQFQVFEPGTADERMVEYDYDPNGNVTTIAPPGHAGTPHELGYTPVNLEERYEPPAIPDVASPETTYAYNLDRQLELVSRPDGHSVAFGYDPTSGRLDTITLQPAGEVRTYGYDAQSGRVASLSGPGADLAFGYDGPLLTSETWSWTPPLDPLAVMHGYDDDLRPASLQVGELPAVNFTYDDDSLLTNVGDLVLTRDAAHGLVTATSLSLGPGQVVHDATSYTPFGEPESYAARYNDDTPLYAVTYDSRDRLGRLTQKTETVLGESTVYAYAYDPAGRLREVKTNGAVSSTYTYDANGNRLSHEVPGVGTTTATYDDQDRLLTYGDAEYEYTANGDLALKRVGSDVTTYTYDALGNLRTVVLPSGSVIEYLIDGRNRRIGKKVDGVFTQGFVYGDQLNPVAELGPGGGVVAQFIYGSKPNMPDYMIRYNEDGNPAGSYRFITDQLGSPRLVVSVADGSIQEQLSYDQFGNIAFDSNPSFQSFGFAGGLRDRQTGLTRFGARDYDPGAGRWVARDPIGFQGGGTNLYEYVLSDPVNMLDPTGKLWGSATAVFVVCTVWNGVQTISDLYGMGLLADQINRLRGRMRELEERKACDAVDEIRKIEWMHDLQRQVAELTEHYSRSQAATIGTGARVEAICGILGAAALFVPGF
ncbi:MAG: RHS repeat-associated core domain-containing protein [Deltaproteobacteria bacterium]|nr:RHS repeat-associated core domain-containing protein [Deltaproteobacteria bacterium]